MVASLRVGWLAAFGMGGAVDAGARFGAATNPQAAGDAVHVVFDCRCPERQCVGDDLLIGKALLD